MQITKTRISEVRRSASTARSSMPVGVGLGGGHRLSPLRPCSLHRHIAQLELPSSGAPHPMSIGDHQVNELQFHECPTRKPVPSSRRRLPGSLGSKARSLDFEDGPDSAEGGSLRGNFRRKYQLQPISAPARCVDELRGPLPRKARSPSSAVVPFLPLGVPAMPLLPLSSPDSHNRTLSPSHVTSR